MRISPRRATLAGMVLLGSLLVLQVGASTPATAAFPPDQVTRGEEVWNNVCIRCHAVDSDNPDAPKLLEPPPIKSFATAAGMFQYVKESMPFEEPGTLSDQQYWDVIAFIVSKKGVPTGDSPLGPENAQAVPVQAP